MLNKVLLAAFCLFFFIPPLPASAMVTVTFCTPPNGGTTCLAGYCDTLGKTTMDGDKKNIIACTSTTGNTDCSTGNCTWLAMSAPDYHAAKEIEVAQSVISKYQKDCTSANYQSKYIVCASACSRYCSNSCKFASSSSWCDGNPDSGLSYVSGTMVAWNASTVTCACFY